MYTPNCLSVEKIRWLPKLYLIIVFAGIGLFILYVALNTTGHLPSFIKSNSNNYLLFNDDWGDLRGGTWRATMGTIGKSFADYPINAIFGWGPDCYSSAMYTYYADELNARFGGAVLTAAHNEWLNMFVNFGIIGGVIYAGIFAAAVRRFNSKVRDDWGMVAIIVAIFAYIGVDFFAISRS